MGERILGFGQHGLSHAQRHDMAPSVCMALSDIESSSGASSASVARRERHSIVAVLLVCLHSTTGLSCAPIVTLY